MCIVVCIVARPMVRSVVWRVQWSILAKAIEDLDRCALRLCVAVVCPVWCAPKGDFVCPSGMGYVCTEVIFSCLWLMCVPEGSKYLPFRNAFNPGRHSSPTHLIDKFGMMHIAIFHADYSHFSVLIVTCKPVHRGGELIYRILNPPSQEEGVAVARS